MRIGIAVDYGKYANASSLNLIARKVFLELGKIMNQTKDFTVTAIKYEDIGLGDVNQHFDCICIPNMGGYRFPHQGTLSSNNLFTGIIGIDEVVLGEQVYKTKRDWEINKPIIQREIDKWKKYSHKIKSIFVTTESDKQQLIKYLEVPENKINVISLGVDHETFKPTHQKEKDRTILSSRFLMSDSPYFIHVSEANWARKNVFRMLDAFEKAKQKGIIHNLILVGKMDEIVKNRANSIYGVKVLGFVSEEDLIRVIKCADALILPSLHEGFGLPLVEAMACGVPVITSNIFSPPEIIGDAGLLVDPYDISDITDKISEFSRNRLLQEILSNKALEQSKKYSWSFTADKLLNLIREKTTRPDHFNFDDSFNLAAYRTLVTVCEIKPELRSVVIQDLLQFDYSKIIEWALTTGLEMSDTRDFLIPFRDWLIDHSKSNIPVN